MLEPVNKRKIDFLQPRRVREKKDEEIVSLRR